MVRTYKPIPTTGTDGGWPQMVPANESGYWVAYDDYARLEEVARMVWEEWCRDGKPSRDALDALREVLKEK